MKELRLTFAAERFGAVSQFLVDMGIGFSVEPVEAAARPAAPPRSDETPQPRRRQAKKAARKSGGAAKKAERAPKPPAPSETSVAGAERLRAAVTRSGTGAYRSPLDDAPEPGSDSMSGGLPGSRPPGQDIE